MVIVKCRFTDIVAMVNRTVSESSDFIDLELAGVEPLTLEDITTDDAGHTRNSSNTSTKSQTSVGYSSQSSQQAHSRQSSEDSSHNRNPSAGSSDTGIFGSMEKNKGRRVDRGGRVDPEEVINELMEDIQLDNMAVPEGETKT